MTAGWRRAAVMSREVWVGAADVAEADGDMVLSYGRGGDKTE